METQVWVTGYPNLFSLNCKGYWARWFVELLLMPPSGERVNKYSALEISAMSYSTLTLILAWHSKQSVAGRTPSLGPEDVSSKASPPCTRCLSGSVSLWDNRLVDVNGQVQKQYQLFLWGFLLSQEVFFWRNLSGLVVKKPILQVLISARPTAKPFRSPNPAAYLEAYGDIS